MALGMLEKLRKKNAPLRVSFLRVPLRAFQGSLRVRSSYGVPSRLTRGSFMGCSKSSKSRDNYNWYQRLYGFYIRFRFSVWSLELTVEGFLRNPIVVS